MVRIIHLKEPSYELNEFGFYVKGIIFGQFIDGSIYEVFDGEKIIKLTEHEYLNFVRERKLKTMLN